jgi:hypothetical protein
LPTQSIAHGAIGRIRPGRPAVIEFLTRKWRKELHYHLIKELWAFDRSRIACASHTSDMTIQAIGLVPMGTEMGTSTKRD